MEAQARRFVADVSHELRTPLAALAAVTDVLDENAPRLDQETGDVLRLVSEGTARLSELVEALMEISRFDAGAADLNVDEVDLAESVQRTLAARGWQGQVETHLPRPGMLRARVDPRRLDVVMANLVGNALRHGAPPVRLTMGVRKERADVAWAVIEVTDSGPGIPEEAMPHIFERFYKASTSWARSESSGPGLAITAENVHLHGGRISVECARARCGVHGRTLPAPRRRRRRHRGWCPVKGPRVPALLVGSRPRSPLRRAAPPGPKSSRPAHRRAACAPSVRRPRSPPASPCISCTRDV
ncbi:HAMP domain-containing sensor histidine kinase [Streptomyces spiralis]|nr:HAMP domain-containing sensor histidine kinase [Streptomyces spiralis]